MSSIIGLFVAVAGFVFVLVCVALVSPRFHRDQPPPEQQTRQDQDAPGGR